jgi:O-antigen/teichoic acid export membrane protein
VRKPLGSLTKDVAIYGAGDVAVTAAGILLLPLYFRVLTQEDYGALALLLVVETVSKILFRFGLDGAFLRHYLDCEDDAARRRLGSTLVWFLVAASGTLVALGLMASPWIAAGLFGGDVAPEYLPALQLLLVNMFLLTFTFVPFHLMRVRKAAVTFSAFTFGRSVSTLLLRIVLVLWLQWGVTGLMLADLIVTVILLPILWPWARAVIGPVFSGSLLRTCLRFGLPRLPHGLALQALDGGNKYLLNLFVPLSSLGVYQISTTIGQAMKLFLSAFETGWAPFYYATARQPDAQQVFRKITTYGVAVLVLLAAGLTAIAGDLVRLMTLETPWSPEAYAQARVVIPLIAIGLTWQGVYLLTSIGLNITSQTRYYPLATFAAAGVGLGSGVLLMPAFGLVGAATSFLLSYLTLAIIAGHFARKHYPMTYETGRLVRVVLAGVVAAAAGVLLPDMSPLTGLFARGGTTCVIFVAWLALNGFLRPTERALIMRVLGRTGQRP